MDMIFILMLIIGTIISFLLLKGFKIYKRIIVIFIINLIIYIFHAPIIYSSVLLVENIYRKANIELYSSIAKGMFLAFFILAPMYAYSYYKYKSNKKFLPFLLYLISDTIIFIVFLCIIMLIL